MGKRGPKLTEIDWTLFERLCGIHATITETADVLGISIDTLERCVKRKYNKKFAEIYRQKSSKGKVSLRRAMWQKAVEQQDNTMMIWLSKNHLAMTDKNEETVKQESPSEVKIIWQEVSSPNKKDEDYYDK